MLVGDELVGDLARIARDDLEHLARQARLVEQLGEVDTPTSGVFSEGFSTMRLLVAIDGATLCATWFIGMVEGRDRAR